MGTNDQYKAPTMNNQYKAPTTGGNQYKAPATGGNQYQTTGTMNNYNAGQQNSNYGGQAMANNGYNGNNGNNGYNGNNNYVETYENHADTCFHCDAPTLEECQRRGMVKPCRGGTNKVCMIEYRMRNGQTFGVCMGCKEQSVCLNQRAQNFNAGYGYRTHANNQCRPESNAEVSVCRNCCKGKNCWGTNTYNFVLNAKSTVEDWIKDRGVGRDTSMEKKPTYGGSSSGSYGSSGMGNNNGQHYNNMSGPSNGYKAPATGGNNYKAPATGGNNYKAPATGGNN